MNNLNFMQARYIFGRESAIEYFVLVETYKMHLSEDQKRDFISATSINEMLELLNENQLNKLNSICCYGTIFLHVNYNTNFVLFQPHGMSMVMIAYSLFTMYEILNSSTIYASATFPQTSPHAYSQTHRYAI
jgi:hypothetical protein